MTNEMNAVAIVQARMGSTRLPGKVMLPLDAAHVLTHTVGRSRRADVLDDVVVATSTEPQDEIIERFGERTGVTVYRGSESDVLDRMYRCAADVGAGTIVRITADCPLVHPGTIDAVVRPVVTGRVDYAANILDRTFPRGLDVEVFTFGSFERVHDAATKPHQREHVTPYYREHPEEFELLNVTSDTVFSASQFRNRTDLRLTLDEAADYDVLREIYERVPYDDIVPIRDAIQYVDKHELMNVNETVTQKEV